MLRNLIRLVVFLLIANAAVRVGLVYWRYEDFKDAVRETALFAGTRTDEALKDKVMDLATVRDVPLDREYVRVERQSGSVSITASYIEVVQLVPGYRRNWQFDVTTR
jgi:hypothetical protein